MFAESWARRYQAFVDKEAAEASVAPEPSAPALVAEDPFPRMPVRPYTPVHREKIPDCAPSYPACVARPVGKKEIRDTPAAQAALLKEWDKLRKAGCWDESRVCASGTLSDACGPDL